MQRSRKGTNPVYITNTEHDCSCCKNFINNLGLVVAIKDVLQQTQQNIRFRANQLNKLSEELK